VLLVLVSLGEGKSLRAPALLRAKALLEVGCDATCQEVIDTACGIVGKDCSGLTGDEKDFIYTTQKKPKEANDLVKAFFKKHDHIDAMDVTVPGSGTTRKAAGDVIRYTSMAECTAVRAAGGIVHQRLQSRFSAPGPENICKFLSYNKAAAKQAAANADCSITCSLPQLDLLVLDDLNTNMKYMYRTKTNEPTNICVGYKGLSDIKCVVADVPKKPVKAPPQSQSESDESTVKMAVTRPGGVKLELK